MTVAEFRKIALEIPTAVERSHMISPISVSRERFCVTCAPDESWGMVKLTPEQQRAFIKKAPRFSNHVAAPGTGRATRMFILRPRKRALSAQLSMLRQRTSRQRRRRNAKRPIIRIKPIER
jgi:hypothetical protein